LPNQGRPRSIFSAVTTQKKEAKRSEPHPKTRLKPRRPCDRLD